MTFANLRDARPGSLTEAVGAWRSLATQMTGLERRVDQDVTRPLRSGRWAGDAADAAFTRLSAIGGQAGLAALQSRTITAVLDAAATRFGNIQQRLRAALDAVALLELTVDGNGAVHPPPDGPPAPTPEQQLVRQRDVRNAEIYTELIAKLVAEATAEDQTVQHALGRLEPDRAGAMDPYEWKDAVNDAREAAALLGVDEAAVPTGDPTRAAVWWRGLTDDQRQLYLVAYPERVGALDGLPAVDRDEANRLALHARLGELEMASTWSPAGVRDTARLSTLLATLDAARFGPPDQQLLLLGLDNKGDGRAVVAVGDPDTARHTAVMVPGVGTTLDGMRGQIDRAVELHRAARSQGGPTAGGISVIAWLGYDTPGLDGSAVSDRLSKEGAVRLDAFTDGLRAAHTAGPVHTTVVGHSYGSTVVGEAASHGDGLAVDDIVTAGSPGMHVNDARDLHLDPRHVWAGAAADDPISGSLGSAPGIHGREPSDESFGANRYHVDTSGHSGYWTPGSASLDNQARIVVGRYGDVGLDTGRAPQ
ncbi:hypothetical protein GCM10027605_41590 [Micromonospora zhanjiangensis]